MKKVLDSTLQTKLDLEEEITLDSEQWISELQRKMEDEISLKISTQDFVHNFKSMKESKASSPSGHHIGHYIVTVRMEDKMLQQIYVFVTAMALISCSPLPHWKKCLQIMLDKVKGLKVDKLWIIQGQLKLCTLAPLGTPLKPHGISEQQI